MQQNTKIREPALEFVTVLPYVAADALKREIREPALEFVIVLPYVAADAPTLRRSVDKKTSNFKFDFDHQIIKTKPLISKNVFKDPATFESVYARKIRGFENLPLSL